MNILFLFLSTLLMFSCTSDEFYEASPDYRNKSYQNAIHSGSTCNTNCIWSTYSVENKFQSPTKSCVEGPCACVVKGDASKSCELFENEAVSIEENPQQTESSVKSIPYYNQYYNQFYGYATCQNTSIAMALSHYEETIHPDIIYKTWGKDYAQSPSGLNAVYSSYSYNSKIKTHTNASPEQLINALQNGYTVIVHGYFTNYGHVLVVRGFKDNKYYVNDPAGKWDECFKCGYNNTNDLGGVTTYSKDAFEAAVFTSDGYNYLPGWIHLVSEF